MNVFTVKMTGSDNVIKFVLRASSAVLTHEKISVKMARSCYIEQYWLTFVRFYVILFIDFCAS